MRIAKYKTGKLNLFSVLHKVNSPQMFFRGYPADCLIVVITSNALVTNSMLIPLRALARLLCELRVKWVRVQECKLPSLRTVIARKI